MAFHRAQAVHYGTEDIKVSLNRESLSSGKCQAQSRSGECQAQSRSGFILCSDCCGQFCLTNKNCLSSLFVFTVVFVRRVRTLLRRVPDDE